MTKLPPLDPPNELALTALAEHLVERHDDPVEVIAEALDLSVKEFLEFYAPSLVN
jgi:hypothetical protein